MNRHCLTFLLFLLLGCRVGHIPTVVHNSTGSASPDAVVVAGLNTNSRLYGPLQQLLSEQNLKSLLLSLGEEGGRSSSAGVERWRSKFSEVLSRTSERAVLVGYSQGALLVLDYVVSEKYRGERVVLFAPPLALRWYVVFLRILLPFKPLGVVLPSLANPSYRLRWGVSLAAYSILFKLRELVESRISREGPFDSSGLVILHRGDELVDSEHVLVMFRHYFPRWRVMVLEDDGPGPHSHLVVHPDALGPTAWSKIKTELQRLLPARQAAPSY